MTIAIIGAGNVGQALATAFAEQGESIVFGVTDPAKTAPIAAAIGHGIGVASVDGALAEADRVILAVPYAVALTIAGSIVDWQGRILIDVTNPIAPGLAGLSVGTTTSGAEQIAARARNARVVKAFNTTGAENLRRSTYPASSIFMPVCGDDAGANGSVVELARRNGFDAIDAGPLSVARYLEPFAMTWIHLALRRGLGRDFAFARISRPD